MILINKKNKEYFVKELAMMHNLRKRIFKDKCKWDVNVVNEMEFDQFDNDNAQYLLEVQKGEVIASARLIPTTSPYILGDFFSESVEKQEVPRCDNVWEITRFCADPQKSPRNIMGVLLGGIIEYGLEHSISYFVSIADVRTERLIKKAGWFAERLGEPIDTGTEMAVAQRLDVNDFSYRKLLEQSKIPSQIITNLHDIASISPKDKAA